MAETRATLKVSDPYSGEKLGEIPFATSAEIQKALDRARAAFQAWRHSSAWERAQLLNGVAAALESRRGEFAELMVREAGKPLSYAQGEVDRALGVLRWAASEAQRLGGELLRLDAGQGGRPGFGLTTRFPRGVILGITPFNFPLNLVVHKVAPAVACGCSIVIKPSPATPLTALKLVELFQGAPDGLVQAVIADDAATEALTRAPEIAMISFTGSSRVGWMIRRQAPEKPTALELGGNAWVVVLEDTPESAYPAIAKRITGAAYGYAGQSCISVQNVAVHASAWPRLRDLLARATEGAAFGDPRAAGVISGPVINSAATARLKKALESVPKGCTVARSKSLSGISHENVITPSLLLMEPASALTALNQEEVFGPVMSAMSFERLPDLIRHINSSRYGLQAGVYTQNWAAIETLYRELEVGGVIVNDVPTTRYDHQPYGGVKDSGQGREGVRYAMEEMTELKFLALSSRIL